MYRLHEKKLNDWRNNPAKKPLIIRGARQVGKTHAIDQLGKQFSNYVKIDFERTPQLRTLFQDLNLTRILQELEIRLDVRIIPGQTLLFFDEVQLCPPAITVLRYFYEEIPELHVVAAGSLLEFVLGTLSIPVGRVQFLEIGPMTFCEFLHALGKSKFADLISQPPQSVSSGIHDDLLALLKQYFFVGGMPEAVQRYCNSLSFKDVSTLHQDLLLAYRQDYAYYQPHVQKPCLDQVWRNLSRSQQVTYTQLAPDYSIPTIKNAVSVLEKAYLIYRVEATQPYLPLGAGVRTKKFKVLALDIGLQIALCGGIESAYTQASLLDMFRGLLAEQFVGQTLRHTQGQVYYWAREAKSSTAEIDFLCQRNGGIIPIEVKSKSLGRLRSLEQYLQAFPHTPQAVVFSEKPYVGPSDNIVQFYPLYYAEWISTPKTPA